MLCPDGNQGLEIFRHNHAGHHLNIKLAFLIEQVAHRLVAVLSPHKFKGIAQAIARLAARAELDRGRLEAPASAFLLHLLESPGSMEIRT